MTSTSLPTDSLPTETLANLITKKHQVLKQLCEAARQQLAVANQGDVSTMLQLLASKQQLITDLQCVEHELRPHHKESPAQRQWRSENERDACRRRAYECNTLLNEIIHLENQSGDRMTARHNEAHIQSKHGYTSAQAHTAYTKQQVSGGRWCTKLGNLSEPAENLMEETLDAVSESHF